ncbi:DivIVA domain-containing protein [Egibacter rhizosphaerae]|uniref:Cell wall synthesis protein Wag31 n=1 Tax=Egibacter rhizosphaerae TaxID=1670831 RepID=A0A411YAA3_9ACTN|nr:DivIVA domain-containing protein [Egibacter rhizosphaerae]QBI18125.1 DivIVA domain-containing protein [Egibacter rhizosphaerae]
MSLTSRDVLNTEFPEKRKGYDGEEVDRFLDRVAARMAELEQERDNLRARVDELERAQAEQPAAESTAEAQAGVADASEQSRLIERALVRAEQIADQTIADAEEEAERLRQEARTEADQVLERARHEADQLRQRVEEEVARERAATREGVERVRRAIAELRQFRDDYRDQVRAVVAEQLTALDRAGDVPDLPESIEQLGDLHVGGDSRGGDRERTPDDPPEPPSEAAERTPSGAPDEGAQLSPQEASALSAELWGPPTGLEEPDDQQR